jgi:predicted Holliday junction resolvase-like endonuclease
MRQMIQQIDPSLSKLKYDPKDIKVISHPVDLVVFDGLNSDSNRIKNVIFVARTRSKSCRSVQRSLSKALSKGRFVWETVQVGWDGTLTVRRG